MSVPFDLPSPLQEIASPTGGLDHSWFIWLQRLILEMHQSLVPPKSIVPTNLSAADIADNFDGTGKGNAGGPYEWWAICNGNNDTPNLSGRYLKGSTTSGGTLGGSASTDASSTNDDVSAGAGLEVALSTHTHSVDPLHMEAVFLMKLA